jgi:hypothetical protein
LRPATSLLRRYVASLHYAFVAAVPVAPLLVSAAADTRYARVDLRYAFVAAVPLAPLLASVPAGTRWRS